MSLIVGRYRGHALLVQIDGSQEQSFVSRDALQRLGEPSCVIWETSEGLRLPAERGEYVSRLVLIVADAFANGVDVVLGQDWIEACQPECSVSGLRGPMSGACLGSKTLPHSWMELDGGMVGAYEVFCMVGNIAGISATIVVDFQATSSSIRKEWLVQQGIADDGFYLPSGPIVVPCSEGYYHSRIPLLVRERSRWDVVLGRDWLSRCQPVFGRGCLVCPSPEFFSSRVSGEEWVVATPLVSVSAYLERDVAGSKRTSVESESVVEALKSILNTVCDMKEEMVRHGLRAGEGKESDQRRRLLRHLLEGGCARKEAGDSCRRISGAPRTCLEMECVVLSVVVDGVDEGRFSQGEQTEMWGALQTESDGASSGPSEWVSYFEQRLHKRENTLRFLIEEDGLDGWDGCSLEVLKGIFKWHGLRWVRGSSKEEVVARLNKHYFGGACANSADLSGCVITRRRYGLSNAAPLRGSEDVRDRMMELMLGWAVYKMRSRRGLVRLLKSYGLSVGTMSLSALRRFYGGKIGAMVKGKQKDTTCSAVDDSGWRAYEANAEELARVRKTWPTVLAEEEKWDILREFRKRTSREAVATVTCGACGERVPKSTHRRLVLSEEQLGCLMLPEEYFAGHEQRPSYRYKGPHFSGAAIDARGVDGCELICCVECASCLRRGKTPPLSLANGNVLGDIPVELKGLTVVEESMVAQSRSRVHVLHLKEDRRHSPMPYAQRGVKGHIIVHPQRPAELLKVLPPSMEEVITPVCAIFVGAHAPSPEWLKRHATPLVIRRERVRSALLWLKAHNPLYADVEINHGMLNQLEEEQVLPITIEHIPIDEADEDEAGGRYDHGILNEERLDREKMQASDPSKRQADGIYGDIEFRSVVIDDVDGRAPLNELKAAAVRHMKQQGKPFLQVPRDPMPVREYFNPELFPRMYPTLFPYGVGGLEDHSRAIAIGFNRHLKHLFRLADRRFQEHYSFLFAAFNIVQRRQVVLHTSLKVQRASLQTLSKRFKELTPEAVHRVCTKVENGEFKVADCDVEEHRVVELLKEVEVVNSHVPGTAAAKMDMRQEIRALTLQHGLPSFYVTVNPADIYHPLVRFLAGDEIADASRSDSRGDTFFKQAMLISRNPVIAADFFELIMKAFIECLLGWRPRGEPVHRGLLGVVKGYYGCVETQGRGSLHCHMVLWLEGGMDARELRDRMLSEENGDFERRLVRFIDEAIWNSIPEGEDEPEGKENPCAREGVDLTLRGDELKKARERDLRELARVCQRHVHGPSCYRRGKGLPTLDHCRHDLDGRYYRATTYFDKEEKILRLRCLDGMVNNYHPVMLEALRCNMDISLIGSIAEAKAVTYYVTNYIAKAEMKAHLAYAAVELGLQRSVDDRGIVEDLRVLSKRVLNKCAMALISQQEMSAQFVALYLLGQQDHYTSHEFRRFFWPNFEWYVELQLPSPECRKTRKADSEEMEEEEEEQVLDDEREEVDERMLEMDGEAEVLLEKYPEAGDFVERPGQVYDFVHRGNPLSDVCLWEYIARVEGKRKVVRGAKEEVSDGEDMSDVEMGEAGEDLAADNEEDGLGYVEGELSVLAHRDGTRPEVPFRTSHRDRRRRTQRVLRPDEARVPVPLGPTLPRRDREEDLARYSRLMLILFKPWREAGDLKEKYGSWSEAFQAFQQTCPQWKRSIMDNMQMQHETKDATIDHFVRRRVSGGDSEVWSKTEEVLEAQEGDILEHMDAVDEELVQLSVKANQDMQECVTAALGVGLYRRWDRTKDVGEEAGHTDVGDDCSVEQQWRSMYTERKDRSKRRLVTSELEHYTRESVDVGKGVTDTGITQAGRESFLPEVNIRSDIAGANPEVDVDIEEHVARWTLNREQARAFRIIAEHSLQDGGSPLRMFMSGAGGTGKSRVINALKDFFERRRQERRFRLAAFTGVAASNIRGTTLHGALGLDERRKSKASKERASVDARAMWVGVRYLFIDEVSMIGCALLHNISKALCDATGNPGLFGGLSVIFAGDFAQLRPVGDIRLYAPPSSWLHRRTLDVVLGHELWRAVDIVVELTEQMRQSGEENKGFVELLGRLREGRCTDTDHALLNTRVIGSAVGRVTSEWAGVPIIVGENALRDVLNEHAVKSFAMATGRPLRWYFSEDSHDGKVIDDADLRERLWKLDSGKTQQRLGRIPVVLGMRVMITQNHDVDGGIVNGSMGVLKKVRYRQVGDVRVMTSCVVDVDDQEGDFLPELSGGERPVLEDSVRFFVRRKFGGRQASFKRVQVPIVPGYAMTAHKAQGRTMSRVIVDLQGCRGTEAPYVMVSRATSLEGLLILRPFKRSKICSHPSEDRRRETERLELLRLETLVRYGDAGETAEALRRLGASAQYTKQRKGTGGNRKQKDGEATQSAEPRKRKRDVYEEDGSMHKRAKTASGSRAGSRMDRKERAGDRTREAVQKGKLSAVEPSAVGSTTRKRKREEDGKSERQGKRGRRERISQRKQK